jgi:uncharacterized membrane protein
VTVQSNKTLGAVGACLTITGVISTVVSIIQQVSGASTTNWIGFAVTAVASLLALVGSILFLVAMYGFSKDYAERRIIMYIVYGILIAIISGVIIGVAWIGFAIISVLGQLSNAGSPSGSAQMQALINPFTAILIPALSAIALVTMLFIYKSYNLLAEKSGVPLFRTAAKIFVLSAILNIILAAVFAILAYTSVIQYTTIVLALTPGAFIQYIAWALSAKGFFTIQPPAPPTAPTQPYPTANQTLHCPNCGAQTQPGNVYCVRCGKKL